MEKTSSRYDFILAIAVFAMLGVGTYLILSERTGTDRLGKSAAGPLPVETLKKAATHGGVVTQTEEFLVETVFQDDGLRVYLYDHGAKSLSLEGATAKARVEFPETDREAVELSMAHAQASEGPGDSLEGKGDLGMVHETGAIAKFDFDALPGKKEARLKLLVPLPKASAMEEKKGTPQEKLPEPEEKKIPPESP